LAAPFSSAAEALEPASVAAAVFSFLSEEDGVALAAGVGDAAGVDIFEIKPRAYQSSKL
jgi:hypothetical protein